MPAEDHGGGSTDSQRLNQKKRVTKGLLFGSSSSEECSLTCFLMTLDALLACSDCWSRISDQQSRLRHAVLVWFLCELMGGSK